MKAKKYQKGGKVTDPRKKYSTMPQTPEEIAEFKEMMWKKKNEISPSAPVGGEAQRTKYEERFMEIKDKFSKGGKMPMYKDGGKWIQEALAGKKEGTLHKQMGVPMGEKIPMGKLEAAAKKGGKLGKRAQLAMTLRKLKK